MSNIPTPSRPSSTEAACLPCGLCIDEKGRRIGWKVKTARMIYDKESASVTLEQPALELLGMQVAWLPWFWVPRSHPAARRPSAHARLRHRARRQPRRALFRADGRRHRPLTQPDADEPAGCAARRRSHASPLISARSSAPPGSIRLDPGACAGTVGDRPWRGAIQSTGHFTPAPDWSAGWSWTAFTDNAYLPDYGFDARRLRHQ